MKFLVRPKKISKPKNNAAENKSVE